MNTHLEQTSAGYLLMAATQVPTLEAGHFPSRQGLNTQQSGRTSPSVAESDDAP